MKAKQNGFSRFAFVMAVLSVMAVLLGVGVFYWLIFNETVATSGGAKRPISSISTE